MKQIVLTILVFFFSFLCAAQNDRVVKGMVCSENDTPLVGATIYAKGTESYVKTDAEGRFTITVSDSTVTDLYVECPGYYAQSSRIDDTFLIFKLKLDYEYASRAYRYALIEAKLAQDSEKRRIAETKAQAEAVDFEKWKVIDSLDNTKFKNVGMMHSVEVSYGYQFGQGEVIYKNLGYRMYNDLRPIEMKYTIAYRLNNFCSLGVGAGLQYQLDNLYIYPDVFHPSYGRQESYTPLNVPVFLNIKGYMSRGRCQPLLSLSAGLYFPNKEGMADLGAGVNVRLSKSTNMYVLLCFCTTPYPEFRHYETGELDEHRDYFAFFTTTAKTSSVKMGFTF